jgi:hypothetical protein
LKRNFEKISRAEKKCQEISKCGKMASLPGEVKVSNGGSTKEVEGIHIAPR